VHKKKLISMRVPRTRKKVIISIESKQNNKLEQIIKPYYPTVNQLINRIAIKANNTGKLTKMLILISLSYAFLNLPYLIAWSLSSNSLKQLITFNNLTFMQEDHFSTLIFYDSAMKICELFSVLNYGIYFYIYFLSGSVFRNQLKYSSIYFQSLY